MAKGDPTGTNLWKTADAVLKLRKRGGIVRYLRCGSNAGKSPQTISEEIFDYGIVIDRGTVYRWLRWANDNTNTKEQEQ